MAWNQEGEEVAEVWTQPEVVVETPPILADTAAARLRRRTRTVAAPPPPVIATEDNPIDVGAPVVDERVTKIVEWADEVAAHHPRVEVWLYQIGRGVYGLTKGPHEQVQKSRGVEYTTPHPNMPWLREGAQTYRAYGGVVYDLLVNPRTAKLIHPDPVQVVDVTSVDLFAGVISVMETGRRGAVEVDWTQPNWRRPFVYDPKYVLQGNKAWEIPQGVRDKLRTEGEVRGYHGLAIRTLAGTDVLLFNTTGKEMEHFHRQCWGHDGFERKLWTDEQGGKDLSTVVTQEELERRLDSINLDSLARHDYNGVTSAQLVEITKKSAPISVGWAQAARTIRHIGLGLEIPDSIVVLGVGGVGFHAGAMAGMVGIKEVCAIDMDTLAEHNRNRLYLSNQWMGRPKVDAFQGFVVASMGDDAPHINRWLSLDDHINKCKRPHQALLDCTDNLETQQKAWDLCHTKKWRYIRAGYDGGYHVTITGRQPPGWDIQPGATYTTPSWIAGAQIAASLALVKLVSSPDLEATFDIRHITGGEHEEALDGRQEHLGPAFAPPVLVTEGWDNAATVGDTAETPMPVVPTPRRAGRRAAPQGNPTDTTPGRADQG